jgi:histidine triad (HIT) family protein
MSLSLTDADANGYGIGSELVVTETTGGQPMADCIFCKIARGEIPCAKIVENEYALSFLDIGPINAGHALVIPKNHYPTLFELPDEELAACAIMVRQVAAAVYKAVGAAGLNFLQNNFKAAGQLVEHAHFHLIPRHYNDGFLTSWPGKAYAVGEMEKMLEKVQAQL